MHVAGVVVALMGKETGAGAFLVEHVLEAGLPPQIEKPLNSSNVFLYPIYLFRLNDLSIFITSLS